MLELRVLRPGPWLDFMESVQAWQGQHDVVQLALSKKIRGADLFFFTHVALLMWLLAAGSSSLFQQDQTEEEEEALCCLKAPQCSLVDMRT